MGGVSGGVYSFFWLHTSLSILRELTTGDPNG